jgi:hypothetical protein
MNAAETGSSLNDEPTRILALNLCLKNAVILAIQIGPSAMVLDLFSRAEVRQRAVDDFGVYARARIDALTRQSYQLVFDGSNRPI